MPGDKCLQCNGRGTVNVSKRADDPDWILCGKCNSLIDSAIAELEDINGQIEAPMSPQRAEEVNERIIGVMKVLQSVDYTRRASDLKPL